MTVPSGDEIARIVGRSYELWNADDRDGWLAHWKSVTPGLHTLEDPIGTPAKHGWDILAEVWDRTGTDRLYITVERIIVCGNEAAAVCRNEGTVRGRSVVIDSVDLYRFGEDGSTHTRSFWQIPDGLPYGQWTAATGTGAGSAAGPGSAG
ncbi:MAG: nuclear transport factor 2 family protein [Acidimicrobiales bacterium]